ncbi:aspartyl-phosphate phosphatase Spo0E family protein [Microaerobacter geothermalis]|uniref:aspartyl-phosphate phosphatase Spo0E family protein n=1 Tax=Microaerobacter geothermalis TaxID=674972 RepID=UPI001F1C8952|nr:aspartyl-phosphate phosphatase Spo0E family protein [Microaerobacter geothermalis]MCF6093180.1 aspartyl-phosphate phosphatase Spo0E family protein [Microaerobacter geothermalis]
MEKKLKMEEITHLLEKVEKLRSRLYQAVGDDLSKLTDDQIIPISKELDELILLYYKNR